MRTLHQYPLTVRIENAVAAYVLYLWKTFWPARLALYPHPALALPAWQWILSTLLLISVTLLVIIFRSHRYLPVGWFWFLGTLVPVIGLVQVGEASMADRYAYLPLIGIFVMLAWGLVDLAGARKVPGVWRIIPVSCALVALAFATSGQLKYWESDYDLWEHTLAVNQQNPFAHDAIGSALLDPDFAMTPNHPEQLNSEQRMEEARWHFEQALDLRRQLAGQNPATYLPDMATTLNNLGNLDRLQNRPEEARQHYEQAFAIHRQLAQQNLEPYPPDLALILNNLGVLEKSNMQVEEAGQHFEEALTIYRQAAQQNPDAYLPKVAEALNNLGFVERNENRLEEARQHYEEALQIRRQLVLHDRASYLPYLATTLNDLGILDAIQKRTDDARRHYEEALQSYRQLAQQEPDTYLSYVAASLNNLALVDESQNRIGEARDHYTEAVTIYRELAESDADRYAGDVARVDASLQELDKKGRSR